ncbi:MAG TPA: polysaccharide pyruvyl transferase family protein [Candidatus Limnocylindrales bacterium]|nr:polysaccharide pyruvyl transferase family protein [Candidatus Limnocylindrales bacterium]
MRILLRAPKNTLDARPAREVLERNLILGNAGNLLFIGAAQKLLSAPGVRIEPDRARVGARDAGMINERFDHYVVPLANAFRPFYESSLLQHAALLSRLRIPVTVLGVAAQGSVAGDFSRLRPMEPAIRAFLRAVLDRGPSIGVRGELTADYVRGLGFHDVAVIGCPSMFAGGPALPAPRVVDLTGDARVAITISPYTAAMAPIVRANLARYPKLEYIAQDLESIELLLWGVPWKRGLPGDAMPVHPSHPLIEGGRMRLFLDPWPWVEYLRGFAAVFGSRIHGSIAAVLAGTPVVVLPHDSRTLELARYFEIPHRPVREVAPDIDPALLVQEADFGPLIAGHAARWQRFADYLASHRLDHVFAHPGAAAVFDAEVASTAYPAPLASPAPGFGAAPLSVAARVDAALFRGRRALRRGSLRKVRLAALRSGSQPEPTDQAAPLAT